MDVILSGFKLPVKAQVLIAFRLQSEFGLTTNWRTTPLRSTVLIAFRLQSEFGHSVWIRDSFVRDDNVLIAFRLQSEFGQDFGYGKGYTYIEES